MKYKSSGKAWVSYGCAGIYIALIFVSIPWVRSLQEFAFTYFDKELFAYFWLVVLAAVLIGSFIYVKRSYNKRVFGSWLCLFAVGAGYFYFTARLWRDPVELIHFFEYGFLSYLLYRALRHNIRDVTIYFSVSFIILFLGTIDEIIQWVVPNRVWNFRDIGLNFLAGGLFQLGLYKGIRPSIISEKVKPESLKILSIVVAACLLLLGICASMTTESLHFLVKRMPSLSFLENKHNMMSEYGYRHDDPEIGIFYSRFKKSRLKAIDEDKQISHARILNENLELDYGLFLKKYSPLTVPFLYEMRIHIFRRDRYEDRGQRAEGRGQKAEDGRRKEYLTVAYKENQILEEYFGETLSHTSYQWPKEKRNEIEKLLDGDVHYESPVSSNLFTRFSLKGLWAGIGLMLCGLVGANIGFRKYCVQT